MAWFAREELLRFWKTAIELRLAGERASLLGGIDPLFIASLPLGSDPGAQLIGDLTVLNQKEHLADGTVPLRTWLLNAQALRASEPACEIFREALTRFDREFDRPRLEAGSSARRWIFTALAAGALSTAGLAVIASRTEPNGALGADAGVVADASEPLDVGSKTTDRPAPVRTDRSRPQPDPVYNPDHGLLPH